MKKILIVFGTRPEAIKLAPVCIALRQNAFAEIYICNTGQQREMAEKTLSFFGLKSDFNFNVMQHNQTLLALQARLLEKFSQLLSEYIFDAIIVQGDTMSAFCGAMSGFNNQIPVFHVEAGLRSFSLSEPFPEEGLRQMLSRIASLHFVPTEAAEKNLKKENIVPAAICVTGNTVIDALFSLTAENFAMVENDLLKIGISPDKNKVLITVHRRENHGKRLEDILRAIQKIAEHFPSYQFILPVHPNPAVKERVEMKLAHCSNILLLPPLDYPHLCYLMKESVLILTDSGGIQEEAPVFGTPLIILREKTERSEGVENGCAVLVGSDPEKIFTVTCSYLQQQHTKHTFRNLYGDGKASKRIVKRIISYFSEKQT